MTNLRRFMVLLLVWICPSIANAAVSPIEADLRLTWRTIRGPEIHLRLRNTSQQDVSFVVTYVGSHKDATTSCSSPVAETQFDLIPGPHFPQDILVRPLTGVIRAGATSHRVLAYGWDPMFVPKTCKVKIRIEDFTTGVAFVHVQQIELQEALESGLGSSDYAKRMNQVSIESLFEISKSGFGVVRLNFTNHGKRLVVAALSERSMRCKSDGDAAWGDIFGPIDGLGLGPMSLAPGSWDALVYSVDLRHLGPESSCRAIFHISARDAEGNYIDTRTVEVPIDISTATATEIWRD